jgi:hypothetical protein
MPLLGTLGSSGAEGYGQNTPRPVVFTGTPAENVRNHGLVRLTGNAANTLNFPNMTLTTAGYAVFLIKVATVTGGVYTANSVATAYQVVSSLTGVGYYVPIGGTLVSNAQSLTAQTDTSITLGTYFSGTNAAIDQIYLYWVFQNSQNFACVSYTGNATARTVNFTSASSNLQAHFLMVVDATNGTCFIGFPASSTSNGWNFASNASAPTSLANRWGSPFYGYVAIGSASTANAQNRSGATYYAYCWDAGNATTSTLGGLYGGLPQIIGSSASSSSVSTTGLKSIRYGSNAAAINTPNATWSIAVSQNATQTATRCIAGSDFLGGVQPITQTGGWTLPVTGTPQADSYFGFLSGGGVASVDLTTTNIQYATWYSPVSDYYNTTTTSRPFVSGVTQAAIASGVTTSQYNIGNTNKYPFYFTFVMVVSGLGTGAIAARMYNRFSGFARISSTLSPNPYFAFNTTAGGTQADTGYDGNTFGLAGLISTQSHALIYAVEFPRIHAMTMWEGTGTAGALVRHQLNQIPTYMWIRKTDPASVDWILYHNVLGNGQYINITTNTPVVSDTTLFNSTSPTSTIITLGTNAFVNTLNTGYAAFMWCSKAGSVNVGYYPGASASQEITIGFQPSTVIITDGSGTDGTVIFTASIGMTAGSNYRMRLSGAVNNATLGDVCLATTLGFTMASTTILNTAGRDYYFIAFV